MTNHVADKVIVITGAGSGFGRLVSEKTAALGAAVVGGDINAAALLETARAVESQGGRIATRVTDVTRYSDQEALIALALERFGRVDVMLNNAGTMPLAFYADHANAREAWERCIDINIKGVLYGMLAVHDTMIAQGRGHVINVSSIYGNYPVVGAGVYGATKAAVNVLSESLRMESQGRIKVTIVKPTGVPATGLSSGVVNPAAVVGILGHNMASYGAKMQALAAGQLPAADSDPDSITYVALAPEWLADQIVYAINQPWGVAIGDITVRASGDGYIL
ncbi:MAG TPA: short-chain dehydrogenase [Gammaproteobacteria bacterium]|nr:short-chain dehydrogenase [Gammaproteobacteria bacterium]